MKELGYRRTLLLDGLRSIPGLDVIEPTGAFYAWPCIEKLLGKKTSQGQVIANSTDFASGLLDAEGVAVVPGVEFGLEGYFRLSYTLSEKRLAEGLVRIRRFVTSLS
jgi:aspartate aminotransferase